MMEQILAEQRECVEYLNGDGPDKAGAMAGLCDWVAEECLEIGAQYERFLKTKAQCGEDHGFAPLWIPDTMFDFQQSCTEWHIVKGRSANLTGCGMGKTFVELVWAQNVLMHTNRPVLILTPLSVAQQTVEEGAKFGIEVHHSRDGKIRKWINVTNYERLHYFNPTDYAGIVCDEISCLKAYAGIRRRQVTEFMRTISYRLGATATPAPNDYMELGTISEALGVMGQMEMLGRFFKNDQNTPVGHNKSGFDRHQSASRMQQQQWRFKGHAEIPFFRWVCGWARSGRKPSDLGPFSDALFELPPLIEREHIVETRTLADGMLFALPATNRQEELEERRRTIPERCELAAALVADTGKPFIVWCDLNDEGNLLERLIPDAVQISGKDGDDTKEEKWGVFLSGQSRGAISKRKIGGFGLNMQHCPHVVEFATHSYEQHHQGVRRCWRFGQKEQVINDIISTEGQRGAKENMQRKSIQADKMFESLVKHMGEALQIDGGYRFTRQIERPAWL